MSLNTTDLFGKKDLVIPPEVRIYQSPSTQHGGGDPTLLPTVVPSAPVNCQLPTNPNSFIPAQRALLLALRDWIVSGTAPPQSAFSKLSNGSLAPVSSIQIPYNPSVNFSLAQMVNVKNYLDRGALFNVTDASGVMAEPFVVKGLYYALLPQVDADGNDIDGIRNVNVQVPMGTYTGWNPRKAGFSEGDSCDLTGGYIPLFKTQAQRKHLPPAIHACPWPNAIRPMPTMWRKVTAAANSLVAARYLLPQDAALAISQANAAAIP